MITNKFTSSELKTIADLLEETIHSSDLKDNHPMLVKYVKMLKKTEGQLNDISSSTNF